MSPVTDPAIAKHLAIGDRRTGALAAADGTLNWWCLPDFDGAPIFDALLDAECGGFCRLGPFDALFGEQRYVPGTNVAVTRWTRALSAGDIEVADLMAWPEDERTDGLKDRRVILRRLRVTGSDAGVRFDVTPRWNFAAPPTVSKRESAGVSFAFKEGTLGLWTSFPITTTAAGASAGWTLAG